MNTWRKSWTEPPTTKPTLTFRSALHTTSSKAPMYWPILSTSSARRITCSASGSAIQLTGPKATMQECAGYVR